ncbi:sigma-70 family RNA polymerase sigma factor, partial [candidate division GN15 bacterium]|nr:sigma-70 family RNA polymerase sigma factor [candidate division GN15 bacterium]
NITEPLVQQAKNGDREAFSQLVRLMMNRTVALTYRMTGDREAAKDLAQDSFVAAWQSLKDFRQEAAFDSWLLKIAHNKALNYIAANQRKSAAQNEIQDRTEALRDDNRDKSTQDKLLQSILKFVGQLPPMQKSVFELRYYQNMPFADIAKATGKAIGTVKTHYREAVIKLRTYARQEGLV